MKTYKVLAERNGKVEHLGRYADEGRALAELAKMRDRYWMTANRFWVEEENT